MISFFKCWGDCLNIQKDSQSVRRNIDL